MTLLVAWGWCGSAVAQPFVYVANADSDDVTVIDASTNTVATTIGVGDEPRNPAVSPNGTRVYVPNRFDDTVTVINGTTNTVITTIMDSNGDFDEPYSAAVSPDGSRVYIANKEGSGSSTGSLTVINAATNTVLTTIDDPCFVSPEWVTVNPAGTFAYVVSRQGDSVCVVSTASNTVVDEVDVGSAPRSAVVTCDGQFVYVANDGGSPDVSKIRTSDNTVVNGINFSTGGARNMSITPDGRKIYVGFRNDAVGTILVANDQADTITLPAGDSTYATAVLANGSRVYVTDEDDDEVEVIEVAGDVVLTGAGLPIPAGDTPRGVATAFTCASTAPVPAVSMRWSVLLAFVLAALGGGILSRRHTRWS
jgi:YVTN family beta-propeller protein